MPQPTLATYRCRDKADSASGDRYNLNLIHSDQYYPDGQIYDEVYVYGSFLQSKMHRAGVSCSQCHNPHTTQPLLQGNALCSQCHDPTQFDTQAHHHHEPGQDGAGCVDCHMPQTTYMGIDRRRDHGFKVPNPWLSTQIDVPNACTGCHQDQTNQWAADHTRIWYPNSTRKDSQHPALAFAAAESGKRSAGSALSYIAQDIHRTDIIRAAALQRLQQFPGRNGLVALSRAVKNNDPWIRLGAVYGSAPYSGPDRWQLIAPLLSDPVLVVRIETAAALAASWQQLSPKQQQALSAPLAEYGDSQRFNGDRGFARTNLANLALWQGQLKQAEALYLSAIKVEPHFAMAYANLADLYRSLGKEALAAQTLKQGMEAQPDSAALPFAHGLALLRAGRSTLALSSLQRATQLEPDNAHFHYVYGLALTPVDPAAASQAMAAAYGASGSPQHLFALCELEVKQQTASARACLRRLQAVAPPEVVDRLSRQLP